MRHANEGDLDQLEPLLEQLRSMDGLREPKRGKFMRTGQSRSFLHFHAHGDEFFADVRLAEDFERWPATSATHRRALLKAIKVALKTAS